MITVNENLIVISFFASAISLRLEVAFADCSITS